MQLENQNAIGSAPLVFKSIEQKTNQLSAFKFSDALDWNRFKRQILRFTLLILVLMGWGWIESSKMASATYRIWNFNEKFVKKAPFRFDWINKVNAVAENQSLDIHLKLSGESLPTEVALHLGNQQIPMKWVSGNEFAYQVNALTAKTEISFKAAGFESESFFVDVQKMPKWKSVTLGAVS